MTEEGNYIVKGETVPRIINPASLDDQSVSTGVITLVRMEFADIGIDIVRIALRQKTDAVVIVADRFRRENVNQCSNDNMVARTISRVLRGRRKTDEPPV